MKKMIILSHDAMVYEDLAYLGKRPAFRMLMENGAQVKRVRTIYPSITYPVHTSVMTGRYVDGHGITSNETEVCGVLASKWHFFHKDVRTPTIFEAAKKAGYTTGSVFWPITGNNPYVDYLVNEYWSQTPEEPILDAFRSAGSSEEVIEKVIRPNVPLVEGHQRQHPWTDAFTMNMACDMIQQFQPDLMLVHPAVIDGFRHHSGVFTEKVTEALDYTAQWTQQLIDATIKAGTFADTDFIIMSDHGQRNTTRIVNLNVLLREAGLIDVDEAEAVTGWRAWVKSAGMTAQVYLQHPQDAGLIREVETLLRGLCEDGVYGIGQVFTKAEAAEQEHFAGGFSFVLESDGTTSFGSDWRRPLLKNYDLSDYRFGRATHGYLPDKGPQPTLICCGPSFKKGAVVERRPIVDITATVSQILGLDMPDLDGTPITEILK